MKTLTVLRGKFRLIYAWGGFHNGALYYGYPRGYDERRYAVFKTRKEALAAYQDVRRIEIIIREKEKRTTYRRRRRGP